MRVGGEGTGGTGGDVVVRADGHQYDGGEGSGGGSGGGRGRCVGVKEGAKSKTPKMDHQKRIQLANLNN